MGDRIESEVIAIGNDQIRARDGNSEQVNCGIGADTAQVDASDVVDPSCESVDSPGPGGDGSSNACAAAQKKVKSAKKKLKKARKSGNPAKVKKARKKLKKAKKGQREAC